MYEQFDAAAVKAIWEAREELAPLLKDLDFEKISRYNKGYLHYKENPVAHFIDGEIVRFMKTADFIGASFPRSTSILDIGFFIPVIPLALSKLGFCVTALEKLSLYDGALDDIITHATQQYSITVLDFDLFEDEPDNLRARFNVILLLAILEHLNGTPRYLLEKVKSLLCPDGHVIVEVPNVSSLSKRVYLLLKGIPPCPSFDGFYHSDYPFTGHNREYTIQDVRNTLAWSGFEIVDVQAFHHSAVAPPSWKQRVLQALERWGPPSWRPNIWAVGKLKSCTKDLQ